MQEKLRILIKEMTDLDKLRVKRLFCDYLTIWMAGIALGIVAVTPSDELIWLVPQSIAIVLFVASRILTRMIDNMKLLEDLTWE